MEEAFRFFQEVLKVAAHFGLQFNWKKCQLLQLWVEFLGHMVANSTIKPSSSVTEAIANFPEPKTTKQIERFLGLTGYVRKFVIGYAEIARPLSNVLKKDARFVFGQEQQKALIELKNRLVTEPVLQICRRGRETELHADASKEGYGAVLLQKLEEDNLLHPVYYMSRKTSDSEKKRRSYELEILAVTRAVKKFHVYLHGIFFFFIKIVTDCAAFEQTMKKKRSFSESRQMDDVSPRLQSRSSASAGHADAPRGCNQPCDECLRRKGLPHPETETSVAQD